MWTDKSWLSFLFGLTAIAFATAKASIDARIVGGYKTTIEKAPYMIHLMWYTTPICGGSILSAKWVLTAAHCVNYDSTPQHYKIRAGSTYLNGNDGVTRQVLTINKHPSFNREKSLNCDIAMLKVETIPLNGKTMKAIAVCSKAVPRKAHVKISGWGLSTVGGNPSNQLRSLYTTMVPKAACQNYYKQLKITDMMVCTKSKQAKSFCKHDSGGPLVYKNEVCGTVSWSAGCGKFNKPGVYANVNNLKLFINNIMKT